MTDWYGWAGTILNVDLSTMKVYKEALSREFAAKYIGGAGFAARTLYDEVSPGDNALEPENVITIGQGPLSGTTAPSGGRYDLAFKSPLTGIYARSNGGGFFGPELKWTGYDLVVIRGKAEKPVYLWINDEHVELKDATHLWGRDTWTTQRMIRDELGDVDIQVLKIGPAGETMSGCSGVVGNLGRVAGRVSPGAVWGSKNLKAVAVRGNGMVSVAKPKEFIKLCNALTERAKADPLYPTHTTYGTSGWVAVPMQRKQQAAKGLATSEHPLHHQHLGQHYDKNLSCFGCAIHCTHFYSVKSGKYKGTAGEGLEGYVQSVVGQLKVTETTFLMKYNNLCNQLGLHIATPAEAIMWAMQLYEDGIITKEDTDGLEMSWGNEDTIVELLHKIARREGFGEILHDFPINAAKKLGRGSEEYVGHVKGNPSAHGMGREVDHIPSILAYSVATRGADHLTGMQPWTRPDYKVEFPQDLLRKIGQERYGNPEVFFRPNSPEPTQALQVYDTENLYTICDMTGTCKFASEDTFFTEGIHLEDFAELLSTATGVDLSVDGLTRAAERKFLLERAFNAREGIRRIDDYPYPFHYQLKYGKKHPRCDYENFKFSLEDYDKVLDEYYRLRGCDREGIPTREKLEKLDLKDVADDLEHREILPLKIST